MATNPLFTESVDEDACKRFQAAWADGSPLPIEEVLPPETDPVYKPTAALLVEIELELLWKGFQKQAGEESPLTVTTPPKVEDYLKRFPALNERAIVVRLEQYDEELRSRFGDRHLSAAQAKPPIPAIAGHESGMPSFGHYEVVEEIDHGGMGVIFRIRDRDLERDLAIKVLRPEHANKPWLIQRFLEEAKIAGQLQHPGVVPVHELGRLPDQRPYFTMKLIEGRTLAALLGERPDPTYDLPRFLKVFEQVCQTVAYAHSRRVIHRDLKPLNIMVGAFGEVQVMDWGLAKHVAGDQGPAVRGELHPPLPGCPVEPAEVAVDVSTGVPGASEPATGTAEPTKPVGPAAERPTQEGQVLGTPAYMPPEQARGEIERVDERSDVFSLGAILCEILTGQRAYVGRDGVEVFRKAREGDLTDALARLDHCGADAELIALTKHCLAIEPDERPRNAGAVVDAVTAYLASVQERLRHAEMEKAAAQARALEKRRRRRVTLALVASVLLSLLLGAGAWFWRQREIGIRRGETERNVNLALGRAEQLREQAKAITYDNPEQARAAVVVWEQGLDLVKHAEGIAAAGEADEHLWGSIGVLKAEVQEALAQTRKDATLLMDLERAHTLRGESRAGQWAHEAAASARAKALAAYGLDVLTLQPSAVAERLGRCPAGVQRAILLALHEWTFLGLPESIQVHRLVEEIDSDAWRKNLRAAASSRDLSALRQLAAEARQKPVPPVSVLILADALKKLGVFEEAVTLLRQTQQEHPENFSINLNLGAVFLDDPRLARRQISSSAVEESIGYLRAALAVRPQSVAALSNLGIALQYKGDLEGAMYCYRTALELDPKDPAAHISLGVALFEKGDMDGAIGCYRTAVEIDPKVPVVHTNLGNALMEKGDLEGAIRCHSTAIELEPKNPMFHNNLGTALQAKGDMQGAIRSYRSAIEIDPKFGRAHFNLGNALHSNGDPEGASRCYHSALELDPEHAPAHCGLGHALAAQGQFSSALKSLRRGHELGSQQRDWKYNSGRWVRECEELLKLDEKLLTVLEAKAEPADAGERLALAELCAQYKKLNVAAARFYADLFTDQPKLAEELPAGHRYNAACAAALAGTGQGKDDPPPDEEAKTRWRKQALDWLRADLAAWTKHLADKPDAQPTVQKTLRHWQTDKDLSGVRDAESLAKLPAEEQEAWKQLRAEVESLLKKASGKE